MALLYPHLISVRRPIGNFKTWENNSIFWVRISDNPEVDEQEPELLYTSLIHGREFVSLSQTIFYMWYLLENYSKDPEIKQILDHTELYFVPVVNPDALNYNVLGYDAEEDKFNHFHRKNLRDNDGDGTFDPKNDGVDLNRNFEAFWAYDDIGSSPYPGATNYRGPAPFSEPETQALKYFCDSHDFKIALNFHSYGNLLIYPWGYSNVHTEDSIAFIRYGQLLTNLNRYVYGLGLETVGYVTNGDSDDWMYDEHGTLAMTPEIGNSEDDFYPLRERIIPLCKSTLQMNLLAARLVNSLIVVTDESPAFIEPGSNPLNLEFSRYGLFEGKVEITFNALSASILESPAPIALSLDQFETLDKNLSLVIDPAVPYGSSVDLEVVCRQGDYVFKDTIRKVRADFTIPVENGGDMVEWDNTEGLTWGNTTASYKSGPVAITDSPEGLYSENVVENILLKQTIDLTNATSAYAQFWAKWDIEDEFDYVIFQASLDGENWENLCGERSKLGGVFQLYEEPLYDGRQTQWVLETANLEAYLGQQVQLRFRIVTDGFVFKDGFYFDDFKVITIQEGVVATDDIEAQDFLVYPNPASGDFSIQLPGLDDSSIHVFNSLGVDMYSEKISNKTQHEVPSASWPAGLYGYVIYSGSDIVKSGFVSLTR